MRPETRTHHSIRAAKKQGEVNMDDNIKFVSKIEGKALNGIHSEAHGPTHPDTNAEDEEAIEEELSRLEARTGNDESDESIGANEASLENSNVAAAALAVASEEATQRDSQRNIKGGDRGDKKDREESWVQKQEVSKGQKQSKGQQSTGSEGDVIPKYVSTPLYELFKDRRFTVYGQSAAADDVRQMVKNLGGETVSEGTRGAIALVRSASSAIPNNVQDAFSFDFVYYAHSKGVIPDLESFKIRKPPGLPSNFKINVGELAAGGEAGPKEPLGARETPTTGARSENTTSMALEKHLEKPVMGAMPHSVFPTPKKRSSKFTAQEDAAILDLIRRNPYLRSTHSFYAQIAQLPLLSNHTGNSIRFRFRKVLSKQLDWVYKVDPETNDIQMNPETNEPLKIKELPGLLKSQYTAEEDYDLCKCVTEFRENGGGMTRKRKMDSGSIPESIFQGLAEKHPRHSAMSWRDRYRKFASVYGLEKYISYYEECLASNEKPSPMRNLSSRSGLKTSSKRRRTVKAVDAETDLNSAKLTDSSQQVPMDLGAVKIQELARASVESKSTDEMKEKRDANGGSEVKGETKDDNATGATGVEAVGAAGAAGDVAATRSTGSESPSQSANLFEDADEMKALNIDITGTISSHGSLLGNMSVEALRKAEPQPLTERSKANSEEILKDIEELFGDFGSDITSSAELFKTIHDKTGLSVAWMNYWFDCSCGMFNVFIDAVQNYLKTGQLTMEDHRGFWTAEHDKMLLNQHKLPQLYKLHGEDSVNKRKATIMGPPNE
ncbi:hypothetical protein FOA43_000246 [Brettanomyces nanus]|uniref:DNA-binding protein RAP1 n=1 Tax=Eeniella nana TaxID=13502 RepID=A0A875RYE9_EENNA|nr:uncharacterized protein FOA43_000246 [Brettanomyces nanus]QPG72942.1 hypothetical protein FOA43_000246 [Brettanomyces nanus]